MNAYQFISEVYRLLGELNADSHRSLEGISLAPEVQSIVNAFMAAKHQAPQEARVSPPSLPLEAESSPTAIASPLSRPNIERGDAGPNTSLESLLAQSHAGLTNSQFIALLQRAGLDVSPRLKESRTDLVRKVTKAVQLLTLEKRERIARNLAKYGQTGETEGWMKVIKSRKN